MENLTAMTAGNKSKPKVCESCGETFGCGADLEGCWCADVEIPTDVADRLRGEFQDCLCPKCLQTCINLPEKK